MGLCIFYFWVHNRVDQHFQHKRSTYPHHYTHSFSTCSHDYLTNHKILFKTFMESSSSNRGDMCHKIILRAVIFLVHLVVSNITYTCIPTNYFLFLYFKKLNSFLFDFFLDKSTLRLHCIFIIIRSLPVKC